LLHPVAAILTCASAGLAIASMTSWLVESRWADQRRSRATINPTREAANVKAEALLRRHLTIEQQSDWDRYRQFFETVDGCTMRFTCSRVFGLREYRDDVPLAAYCIGPQDLHEQLPIADVLLAQLMYFRYRQAEFFRIANRSEIAATAAYDFYEQD
jgi:hypothetical protein